jgi:outer membrane protein assembly factor BamB
MEAMTMVSSRHRVLSSAVFGLAVIAAACSTGSGSASKRGPSPAAMCEVGASPALAAYDLRTGRYKWSVCSSDKVWRSVLEASDDVVYVEVTSQPTKASADAVPYYARTVVAYDTRNGEVRTDAPAPRNSSCATGDCTVDGVRLERANVEKLYAFDASTGEVLWDRTGAQHFGDWAVGDGAVFAVDHPHDVPLPLGLTAYELRTGVVRWRNQTEMWSPWHVSGQVVFTLATNLTLLSTRDGSVIWRTDYPPVELPWLSGVRANATRVFVAFSSLQAED